MPRAALLIVLLAVLLSLLVRAVVRGMDGPPEAGATTVAAAGPQRPTEPLQPPLQEREQAQPPQPEPAVGPPALDGAETVPDALSEAPAKPSPDLAVADLEAGYRDKYAAVSTGDMRRTAIEMRRRHDALVRGIADERFARREFELLAMEYDARGERLPAARSLPPLAPGELLIREAYDVEGSDQWHIVTIPPAEYPELYAAYRELLWLTAEFRRLEESDEQ